MNIDLSSPTLRHGIGCFETLRWEIPNHIPFLTEHCERLSKGAGICGLNCLPALEMVELIKKVTTCQAFTKTQILRLILTSEAGLTLLHEDLIPRPEVYRLIVSENYLYPGYGLFSSFKSFNYLSQYLAGKHAISQGFEAALMLSNSDSDQVVSANNGNLFFLDRAGLWHTPHLASGCLPGVIRSRLIPLLEAHERPILRSEISDFESVLITNSLIDARPVIQIGAHHFSVIDIRAELDRLRKANLQ